MKKNNLNIVKIDKNKTLFNYKKKIHKKLNLISKLIMRIKNQQMMRILNQ